MVKKKDEIDMSAPDRVIAAVVREAARDPQNIAAALLDGGLVV